MKGIPTRYAGVQFRSRLEARFAAWFDILGMSWDYEPFDLEGWIPDFRTGDLLWEVKPTPAACVAAQEKITQSKPPLPVVISCGPGHYPILNVTPRCVGYFNGYGRWSVAWPSRRVGVTFPDAVSAWREAGNRVQWRAPR